MSFRLKIGLGVVLIQVILLVILVWSSLNFLRASNEVELQNRASSTALLLAATLRPAVSAGDRESLVRYLNEILSQPGTAYVRILDTHGVLVEAGREEALARPFVEDFLFEDVNDGVYDVSSEIVDDEGVVGTVQLGLSTKSINRVMDAARKETSTIAMIGMGVSVLFALIMGNFFARQLTRLRDATRRIASGDIGYQLPVTGNDELAQTANAFNTMSRKLALLYAEKQAALNGARQKASELRASENRIQSVLSHALDAIITIDDTGLIETFNPAAEKIFGYSAAEAVGKSVDMLIPEAQGAVHTEDGRGHIPTGIRNFLGIMHEVEGRRKDGTPFSMEIDVSEVELEGRLLYVAIARDITERKTAERELRAAKDAALESVRSKFEFIADVSEEIRSPVNTMLSTLNVLLENDLTVRQREYVENIKVAGDALITIINDVLDFSKIEAGTLHLEDIDFDLGRTVDIVYQMLKERAGRKGLEFSYVVPYTVPATLRGDPTRLRQLLLNLIDNAIKFTDSGEVVLNIEVKEEREDHVVLYFEVKDTGIGIAPEVQQRIFEIFTRTQSPIASRYKGAGLGLTICKRLVEMMHGQIGVRSELGAGSSFWFTASFDKQAAMRPLLKTSYESLRDLKALVVNASASARASVQNMLRQIGMRVHGAENAMQALDELGVAAIRGQPYDLAIFDMVMPGMSGLQLAHAVRGNDRIASLHMIMVAATGYRGDSEEVRRAGIQGYLTAPVERDQLYDCIAAVMRISAHDHQSFITRHALAADKTAQQGHVLVASEEPHRQRHLLARLEQLGYRASVAVDAPQAIDATARFHYDLVLVDNETYELLGADALRKIRSRENGGEHVPLVILVSPAASRDQCQAYTNAGADECLAGELEIERLQRQVH